MLTITRAVLANPHSEAQFPSACRTQTSTPAEAGTRLPALPAPGIKRSCPREAPIDRTVAPDARKDQPVAAPQ